jgi:protein TonB
MGEMRGQETMPVTDAEQLGLSFAEELPARCGSCGAPLAHGDLCNSCEQAFRSVLARGMGPVAAARATLPTVTVEVTHEKTDIAASSNEPSETTAAISPPKPDPIASVPPRRDRAALLVAASVAIVAMIGVPLGARWLKNQLNVQPGDAGRQPVTSLTKTEAPAINRVAPPSVRSETAVSPAGHEPKPPVSAAAASVRPEATPRTRPLRPASTPAKLERGTMPSADRAAATVVSTTTPEKLETPAPPSVTAPAQPAESQEAVTPQAPTGRFFEPTEVDEVPRIATRVEPQLPDSLSVRSIDDVVVVRILVSHTGHPFRVNLLRRSRLGPAVDDAVIAAVRRWTFSAARRRGEAVSCWFNFAVPLRAN